MTTLKRVALHETHVSLGAKIIPFAGFEMPVRYSSDIEEHNTVRNGVGVFDVSHMGEFMISGSKALELVQKVSSNDAFKLTDGKIQYACLPNDQGGIVDDMLVYRFSETEYMLVVNASNIDKDWAWISQQNAQIGAEMQNISDNLSLFAVQGVKAVEALQGLTDTDLSKITYYSFEKGSFAGVPDVIISATGYTGAGGFELYVPNEHAQTLWNKLFEHGKKWDIKPIGLGARDTLRLEMGYCLYGNDINDRTSPLEAGLGWITKFTKNFVNSENLKAQKERGLSQKLVGFEMIDRGIPRQHYEIKNASGEKIGEVTSGTQSPTLKKGIGMGYVKSEYAGENTEIFIDIRNTLIKAQVIKLPFLKPTV